MHGIAEHRHSAATRRRQTTTLIIAGILMLAVIRWLLPERSSSHVGPQAVLDAVFALGLLGLVLLLATSLGRRILRWLRLGQLGELEQVVFSSALGLGIMAYGVFALSLIGWLRPSAILLWLLLIAIWTRPEWTDLVGTLAAWLAQQPQALGGLPRRNKVILTFAMLFLLSGFLHALTPPWDYDGLMYHLQGPRLFLQAGRILVLPDVWQANGPLTPEMLFTIGLAWGSDSFAKLVHLAYSVCLVLATFAFGRRYLNQTQGWLAVALILGVPILPFWASAAYADMAWALYEFLALYALVVWKESGRRGSLFLAALMMGLALGSKFLALGGLGVLELWILWQGRSLGWRKALTSGALFGGISLLVALPWYAKNWILAGNPVYPFLFGGIEWDATRLDYLMTYLYSFGTGRRFVDYLLLPWNLYAGNAQFGTLGIEIEIPGLLVPLALLYPFGSRHRTMDTIAGVAGLRFLVWSLGSQQTRFLLPMFPVLALLAASGLHSLAKRLQERWPAAMSLAFVLALAGMVGTLLIQMLLFAALPPTKVIVGQQSKSEFLREKLENYRALEVLRDTLLPQEQAMMMWDGQGYYCDTRCLPDADQSGWTRLVASTSDPHDVAARLTGRGVTHLLFNERDAEFFLEHDPMGQHRRAMDFFLKEFLPSCAEPLYRDDQMILAKITCR